MIKLNKKELKIKQVIVQFLKDNNVYPQFIKEFNKGYRKFIIEYYLHVENFDINNTSFNTFIKRINEDKQNTGVLNEAFDWNNTNNPKLWYIIFNKMAQYELRVFVNHVAIKNKVNHNETTLSQIFSPFD